MCQFRLVYDFYQKECLKLTKNIGWKPHVIHGALGISRTIQETWAKNIYPQKKQAYYSTYDLLIFMMIREYNIEHAIQVKRIKEVNWIEAANEIKLISFSSLKKLIFNVNLHNHEYELINLDEDFKDPYGRNVPLFLEFFVNELSNYLLS